MYVNFENINIYSSCPAISNLDLDVTPAELEDCWKTTCAIARPQPGSGYIVSTKRWQPGALVGFRLPGLTWTLPAVICLILILYQFVFRLSSHSGTDSVIIALAKADADAAIAKHVSTSQAEA